MEDETGSAAGKISFTKHVLQGESETVTRDIHAARAATQFMTEFEKKGFLIYIYIYDVIAFTL